MGAPPMEPPRDGSGAGGHTGVTRLGFLNEFRDKNSDQVDVLGMGPEGAAYLLFSVHA